MKISELFNPFDLNDEMVNGYVRMRHHPDDQGLFILGYTEKAQYERRWNDVTRQCRGLICRTDETGEDADVLARPLDKFFNYGEHPEGSLDLDGHVYAADKIDGSLGIVYVAPDGQPAIATRGSFESDQAIEGTRILRERYADWMAQADLPALTYLFEIVYPENRIVLDYGETRDLYFLGSRDTDIGAWWPAWADDSEDWVGPRADLVCSNTLRNVLSRSPRPNAEGLVVEIARTLELVKIKQEDYVRLHKLVTGLNERAVWEHLAAHDGQISGLLESLPDEFHTWVRDTAAPLVDAHDPLVPLTHEDVDYIRDELDRVHGVGCWERAHFAAMAKQRPNPGFLFATLDGVDISPRVWKTLRP